MKKYYILIIAIIILSFFSGLFLNKIVFTGKVISEENISKTYTWTKAICNQDNECMDVIISCENSQVVKITPTSNIIQHSEDWVDPRGDDSKKLCD